MLMSVETIRPLRQDVSSTFVRAGILRLPMPLLPLISQCTFMPRRERAGRLVVHVPCSASVLKNNGFT
jgi:hypothetical protein